ncbi:MAG: hypothetical protein DRP57_01650 [Spirochaetes bacterium]|nr:MAG: hypothetical protein DRP57_01650 [Spirochaetota bacterium]
MGKRRLFFLSFLLIIFLTTGSLFAGDTASFVNLGFSKDSKSFMFGQFGILEENARAYSDIFLVNVASNTFVKSGVQHEKAAIESEPGSTGEGALFNLLEKHTDLKKKYGIDHLVTGRLLYLFVDGQKPKAKIEFRDFQLSKSYSIKLVQASKGSGKSISSSFYLSVDIKDKSGDSKHYQVGLPNYRRKSVKSYRIKEIILGPDKKSIIFVVQKEEVDKKGSNIRYMIETLRTD